MEILQKEEMMTMKSMTEVLAKGGEER